MTPKQIAVASLRDLAKRCLKEQYKLKVLRVERRHLAAQERATYARIKGLKARIDRELIASGPLLGIPSVPRDE